MASGTLGSKRNSCRERTHCALRHLFVQHSIAIKENGTQFTGAGIADFAEHRAIAIRHTLHLKSGELAISQFCLRTIVVFRHTYIQEKAFDLKSDRPKEFDLPFKKVLLE
jgi:hypothetical protein